MNMFPARLKDCKPGELIKVASPKELDDAAVKLAKIMEQRRFMMAHYKEAEDLYLTQAIKVVNSLRRNPSQKYRDRQVQKLVGLIEKIAILRELAREAQD